MIQNEKVNNIARNILGHNPVFWEICLDNYNSCAS